MRIVLVGSGGREAALAWRIAQSPSISSITVLAPNPGWPEGVHCHPASTPAEIVAVAKGGYADLVVVGPEAPLAAGVADELGRAGIPVFGPSAAAARLESSKSFAKEVMYAAGVPTAEALVIDRTDPVAVRAAHERCGKGRVVIKADGLAAGKGVFVCEDAAAAEAALESVWSGRFGPAADRIVLEELLEGPEVSLFALSDGERVVALPTAQDHKRLSDGDQGPNTGGMGAYAPCPLIEADRGQELTERIHLPVVAEMARRGHPFRGLLYAGLMLTPRGPRVLEFNVRFGDPECQPLMCLWDDDILPWLHGAAAGVLPEGRPRFSEGAACCVVLASAGYPLSSDRGVPIPEPAERLGVQVFQAGTRRGEDGVLRTDGGRVLGITTVGADIGAARDLAYLAVQDWRFPGALWRGDIAAQALC